MQHVCQGYNETDEMFLLKGIKLRHYLLLFGKDFAGGGSEYRSGLHSKSQTTLLISF